VSASGETDPGLISLYPRSNDPVEHREILSRHARQLELSVIVDKQHYKEIKSLNATLNRTNELLEQQIKETALEKVGKQLDQSNKDLSVKRMTTLLGFLGAVVGALAMIFVAYLSHGTPAPVAKPLSPAVEKAYEDYLHSLAKQTPPTAEYDRIIDAGK
jgi:hypothetical protein